jgi:hypothetical protein
LWKEERLLISTSTLLLQQQPAPFGCLVHGHGGGGAPLGSPVREWAGPSWRLASLLPCWPHSGALGGAVDGECAHGMRIFTAVWMCPMCESNCCHSQIGFAFGKIMFHSVCYKTCTNRSVFTVFTSLSL